jgi:hemerythrin-like metal-binding protein
MSLIVWDIKYETGVDVIDDDHRHLFKLINDFYDSFVAGSSEEESNALMDELIGYTTFHFKREEQLMKNANYPFFENHKKEHRHLVESVNSFKKRIKDSPSDSTTDLLNFLSNWLINHVIGADMLIVPYLVAKNKK